MGETVKRLVVILVILFLFGCATQKDVVHEIKKPRNFDYSYYNKWQVHTCARANEVLIITYVTNDFNMFNRDTALVVWESKAKYRLLYPKKYDKHDIHKNKVSNFIVDREIVKE